MTNKIQRVGIGSLLGIIGIILMSFGATIPNLLLLRLGIICTTLGGWIITWQ